jgi:hypothetical protein
MIVEPITTAQALVAERFPDARAAFLAGSSTSTLRTRTSDLDIVVVASTPPAYRETITYAGWVVELFVHDDSTVRQFWRREVAAGCSPLLRMCASGVVLASVDGYGEAMQVEARELLRAGPPPLEEDAWSARRYRLSDLLDDLDGATDADERVFIANNVLADTCEMALCLRRTWLGTGKWLARELRAVDPDLLDRVLAAHGTAVAGDVGSLVAVASEVLDQTGGRLTADTEWRLRRPDEPPAHSPPAPTSWRCRAAMPLRASRCSRSLSAQIRSVACHVTGGDHQSQHRVGARLVTQALGAPDERGAEEGLVRFEWPLDSGRCSAGARRSGRALGRGLVADGGQDLACLEHGDVPSGRAGDDVARAHQARSRAAERMEVVGGRVSVLGHARSAQTMLSKAASSHSGTTITPEGRCWQSQCGLRRDGE